MIRGFWLNISQILKCVFGHAKMSSHMVIVGKVNGYSSNSGFMWPLCRAFVTKELWKERNNVQFNRGRYELSNKLAWAYLLRVAYFLKI